MVAYNSIKYYEDKISELSEKIFEIENPMKVYIFTEVESNSVILICARDINTACDIALEDDISWVYLRELQNVGISSKQREGILEKFKNF